MLGESLCGNLNLEFTHWEDSIWNFHKRIHESDKSEDYFIAIVNYTLNYQFNVTDLQFVFIDSYYDKDLYEKENFTNYTEELMNFASSAKQYAWKVVKAIKLELWKIIDQLEEKHKEYDRLNEKLTHVKFIENKCRMSAQKLAQR